MLIEIEKLKPHPKNNYFFDDMTGDKWEDFKQSVSHRLIHAVVVTQDLVIVSGHQRYRAYKELGKTEIEVEIRHYGSDDEALLDLINSNLKERVVGNDNPVKLGRCFAELDRINGVYHGNHMQEKVHFALSQSQTSEQYGVSPDKWKRYKSLTKLIPELEDMVETGKVTATTASAIARKLSPEEQQKFLEGLDTSEKIPSKEAQERIKEIQALAEENEALKDAHKRLVQKNAQLEQDLEDRPEKVVEKEVVPEDYADLKKDLEGYKHENSTLLKDREKIIGELDKARKQAAEYEKRSGESDFDERIVKESQYMGNRINSFIEMMGGYVWLSDYFDKVPEESRKKISRALINLEAWAQTVRKALEGVKE